MEGCELESLLVASFGLFWDDDCESLSVLNFSDCGDSFPEAADRNDLPVVRLEALKMLFKFVSLLLLLELLLERGVDKNARGVVPFEGLVSLDGDLVITGNKNGADDDAKEDVFVWYVCNDIKSSLAPFPTGDKAKSSSTTVFKLMLISICPLVVTLCSTPNRTEPASCDFDLFGKHRSFAVDHVTR